MIFIHKALLLQFTVNYATLDMPCVLSTNCKLPSCWMCSFNCKASLSVFHDNRFCSFFVDCCCCLTFLCRFCKLIVWLSVFVLSFLLISGCNGNVTACQQMFIFIGMTEPFKSSRYLLQYIFIDAIQHSTCLSQANTHSEPHFSQQWFQLLNDVALRWGAQVAAISQSLRTRTESVGLLQSRVMCAVCELLNSLL